MSNHSIMDLRDLLTEPANQQDENGVLPSELHSAMGGSLDTQDVTVTSEDKTIGKNSEQNERKRKSDMNILQAEELMPYPIPIPVVNRRRRTLSIAEKVEVLRRIHEGESQRQLALEYGIGSSTVSDLKKNAAKIMQNMKEKEVISSMERRKLESEEVGDFEKAVLEWLVKEVRSGREVSGGEVLIRAHQEHHRLGLGDPTEFTANDGWLERFKQRYNIHSFKPGDESSWQIPFPKLTFGESYPTKSRRRVRPAHTFLNKIYSNESSNQVLDCSSHKLTSDMESLEGNEQYEVKNEDQFVTEDESNFQPIVGIMEGNSIFNIPNVTEIPSASEAASLLSKALVWAAAQQDTTSQELFILKELQTRAAVRSAIRDIN